MRNGGKPVIRNDLPIVYLQGSTACLAKADREKMITLDRSGNNRVRWDLLIPYYLHETDIAF